MTKYAECRICGTIHYVVNKAEADSLLQKDDESGEAFSKRNLVFCSNCGKSKSESEEVSESYANQYSDGNVIKPILLMPDGDTKATTTNP